MSIAFTCLLALLSSIFLDFLLNDHFINVKKTLRVFK